MISCPACQHSVKESDINRHLDSQCRLHINDDTPPTPAATQHQQPHGGGSKKSSKAAAEFFAPATQKTTSSRPVDEDGASSPPSTLPNPPLPPPAVNGTKRSASQRDGDEEITSASATEPSKPPPSPHPTSLPAKRPRPSPTAPLAERMRPQTLDDVAGQDLVGRNGVLRGLIDGERVPSMILWGGPGTGKTTIARLVAHRHPGTRLVEINGTTAGVGECKRLFAEARNELALTGRRTVVLCDEIHRFSKTQQDVFLAPVEGGLVTLIGATTENPSFKIGSALLSRCRTFTLAKLTEIDVVGILKKALRSEVPGLGEMVAAATETEAEASERAAERGEKVEVDCDRGGGSGGGEHANIHGSFSLLTNDDCGLLRYLAAFADGDARVGLNLLELAIDLCKTPDMTVEQIKDSLTQTLVYDRAGDQHYDTISAFHKSVRGSDPDAALYYLARMLQSGEDPLYIARRMVVIASEDVGLADNSMLSLATATHTAAEKIGMPECRINLAHCTVALCLAPKSVRAYRGLNAAYAALAEPGVAGLPVPLHLRNAPTRLMKELGYGKTYKYNPDYTDGRVVQNYLPEKLNGRVFLGLADLGAEVDPDLSEAKGEADEELQDAAEQLDGVAADEREEDMLLDPDGD